MKIIDKLWNWGHLEGSHNKDLGLNCKMSPEKFAEEYGIRKSFIVSYGGNIQPPYDAFAGRFSVLNEVKWSVLGDASTPLPEAELGNTQDVVDTLFVGKNITGAVVDDFFSPERIERFAPTILRKMQNKLHENGLDFWCVLYNHQLNMDLQEYIDCFDGVTFWVWGSQHLENVEEYLQKLFVMAKGKKIMLGIYLWDWFDTSSRPMQPDLFEVQIRRYFEILGSGEIEGVVFCSNTVGDADTEVNRILKCYIIEYGDKKIVEKKNL